MTELNKDTQEKKLLRKGSFRCAAKPSRWKLMFLMGLAFTAAALVLSFIPFGGKADMLFDTMVYVCIGLELILGIGWAVTGSDKEYSYEAGENDFTVTAPSGEKQVIYYSDVKAISFSSFRDSKTRFGYTVTIVTGLRDITYRCLFTDNKFFTGPEGTPFHYLSVNSGVEIPYDGMPFSSDDVMSRFEDMQKEQRTRTNSKKRISSVEEFFERYGDDEK